MKTLKQALVSPVFHANLLLAASLAGCLAEEADDAIDTEFARLDDGALDAAALDVAALEPAEPAPILFEIDETRDAGLVTEDRSVLAPADDDPQALCVSQCNASAMIIGCDDRAQGNTSQTATSQPWNMIGQVEHQDGGGDCTGTLIGSKFVLTAAHCLIDGSGNFRNEATGFSLSQSWGVEPYGKIYATRAFVPKGYANGASPEVKAFDYAVLELSQAPGNGAAIMDLEYVNWTYLPGLETTAVGYPFEKAEGTVWYGRGDFAADQPYKWFDGGESGILRVNNDGTGGMSGGPLYVWYGGVRKLVGVFIGSPLDECQSGYVWAARMTGEAVERIENSMLYPPNGNVIDFSWDVYSFSSVPATEW